MRARPPIWSAPRAAGSDPDWVATQAFSWCGAASARRLQFFASSDGLLLWLNEECWGRGLVRLAEVLDDLLTEGQAELEDLLPF